MSVIVEPGNYAKELSTRIFTEATKWEVDQETNRLRIVDGEILIAEFANGWWSSVRKGEPLEINPNYFQDDATAEVDASLFQPTR